MKISTDFQLIDAQLQNKISIQGDFGGVVQRSLGYYKKMHWYNKAKIMKACALLPAGDKLYKYIQKNFGQLNVNPLKRIPAQIEMSKWIFEQGKTIVDKIFFEVGTGHIPIVPIGFFLSGAKSVITIDLFNRLDLNLLKKTLLWFVENIELLHLIYSKIVDKNIFDERIEIIRKLWQKPYEFLQSSNIHYLAPADARKTDLPAKSIDYHFSVTVLEHIPFEDIIEIFVETKRLLKNDGLALHFIDLSDHFQHQDDSITRINFLRYSEDKWEQIAGNQFAYCNRMRMSEYAQLFKKLGFNICRVKTDLDQQGLEAIKNGFKVDEMYKRFSNSELCTTQFNVALQKISE